MKIVDMGEEINNWLIGLVLMERLVGGLINRDVPIGEICQ
jgi:hypothetical protein